MNQFRGHVRRAPGYLPGAANFAGPNKCHPARHTGWRVHLRPRRQGCPVNQKKTGRCVKAKLRQDRRLATRPNETWAMDFVHDQLATDSKLRVLTVVDTFSRVSPGIVPRGAYPTMARS
jgi:transposase InsO family protein